MPKPSHVLLIFRRRILILGFGIPILTFFVCEEVSPPFIGFKYSCIAEIKGRKYSLSYYGFQDEKNLHPQMFVSKSKLLVTKGIRFSNIHDWGSKF